jgi:hypothetical protein
MKKILSYFLFTGICLSAVDVKKIPSTDPLDIVADYLNKKMTVGIRASTAGFGMDCAVKPLDWLSVRLSGNYFSINKPVNINIKFDYANATNTVPLSFPISVSLLTVGLLADLHPFKNGFALSFGLFNNQNNISGKAQLGSDSITISNSKGASAKFSSTFIGYATVDVAFNPLSPYFGMRYDSGYAANDGWSFNCELGAIYHGTPKVTVNLYGTGVNLASDYTLNDQKYNGTLQQYVDDQVNKYKQYAQFWPVIGFGVSYKF